MKLTRRSLLGSAGASVAGLAAAGSMQRAFAGGNGGTVQLVAAPEQVCVAPDSTISLFASKKRMNNQTYIGYGLTEDSPTFPGPTLEITEGSCVGIELANTTDHLVSFHPHGVNYTVESDGTRVNKSVVKPGQTRTYVVSANAPSIRGDGTVDPGNAGYWHYHDHSRGTPHGTVGIKRGLFGGLIVRRSGDMVPDVPPIVLVMSDFTFNLRQAPNTPLPEANLGQRVEFLIICHDDNFHTFHLHGHRWADSRTGMLSSLTDNTRLLDARVIGPGDSFGFQIIAGENTGEGAWMYHCHVQQHSDVHGMSGLFVVRSAGGVISEKTQAAIDRWRRIEEHFHGAMHH